MRWLLVDFNRDGKADLAIAGWEGLFILLGNGDGSFQPPITIHDWLFPELVVADMDGDGNPDLVVVAITITMSKFSWAMAMVLLSPRKRTHCRDFSIAASWLSAISTEMARPTWWSSARRVLA